MGRRRVVSQRPPISPASAPRIYRTGKLSKRALDTLVHRVHRAHRPFAALGLGWRIDQDAAKRLRWHHAGGQDGARASLVVYPAEKLSIAFATNVTQTPGDVNGPSAKVRGRIHRARLNRPAAIALFQLQRDSLAHAAQQLVWDGVRMGGDLFHRKTLAPDDRTDFRLQLSVRR